MVLLEGWIFRLSRCPGKLDHSSSMSRIERALALFMVMAWRIAHLMRAGRTCPDLDATLYFDHEEIEAAYLLREKS